MTKKLIPGLLALPLSAGLMLAQSQSTPQENPTNNQTSVGSKTWTGILVASSCSTQNSMPKTTASEMRQDTPKSEMSQTTPQMDRGTRTDRDMNRYQPRDTNQPSGSDQMLDRTPTMTQQQGATGTGSADRSGTPRSTPMDTQAGNNMSSAAVNNHWDRSCFIGKTTSSFAFQTSDGRLLHFDSNGDQQIKSQLDQANRVSTKNKIFRVRVTGAADGDTIKLSNIVM